MAGAIHGSQADVQAIVRLDHRTTVLDAWLLGSAGARDLRELPLIQSFAVQVDASDVARLRAMAGVEHLSLDATVRKFDEYTVAASGAASVWTNYGLTGRGVGVAVVDSGVGKARDLRKTVGADDNDSRVIKVRAFGQEAATDECGHGTHVAGIIAGNGASSTGSRFTRTFYGVAPEANIIGLRVLDETGAGDMSDVIAAIDWAVANRVQYNIRVLNLSLGKPVTESYTQDPLCLAVARAWASGIVVVCAAGNEGRSSLTRSSGADNEGFGTAYGSIQSPANSPYVITVGAMKQVNGSRDGDTIATYSSRGPTVGDLVVKPDLVAPGEAIISVNPRSNYLFDTYRSTNEVPKSYYIRNGNETSSQRYFKLSGTSMAAPVVAGAAALLIQANPALTPDTVKARLVLSADKWVDGAGNGDPFTYGGGYLNIPAALLHTAVATGYAVSPELTITPDGFYSVDLSRAVWGPQGFFTTGDPDARAVWGSRAVWGPEPPPPPSGNEGGDGVGGSRAVWGPEPPKFVLPTSVNSMSVSGTPYAPQTNASSVDLSSVVLNGEAQ